MKKNLLVSVVCASILVAPITPLLAQAKAAKFANAIFNITDASGCISTEVFIFVRSGNRGSGNAADQAFIKVSQVDDCGEKPVVNLSGSARLAKQDLQFDPNLNSVKLDATTTLSDSISHKKLDFSTHLEWTAKGEAVESRPTNYFDQPGKLVKLNQTIDLLSRSAEAIGSITVGGTNFVLGASADAEISMAQ